MAFVVTRERGELKKMLFFFLKSLRLGPWQKSNIKPAIQVHL